MDDLRDLLQDAAEEMRVSPEIPPRTLARVRRRRSATAAVAGALTIAVIGGGFVAIRMLTRPGTQELAQEVPSGPVEPPAELASFVDTFMQARFTQQGVEELMAKPAVDAYNATPETGLSLFRSVEQQPAYQIASWEERGNAYAVQLRIETSPAPIVEELEVGPGTALTGAESDLVVLHARAAPAPLIQVLNGTNEKGLTTKVAQELEANGYRIATTGNASKVYERTTLFYRADSRVLAQRIADDHFGGALVTPAENNLSPEIQVTVVIGLLNTPIEGDPRVHGQQIVERFFAARSEGRDAEEFLTPDAASDFDEGQDGLWLYPPDDLWMYGYGVDETKPTSDGRLRFIVHLLGSRKADDCRFEYQERITAGPGKNQFGESRDWVIMSVSRSPLIGMSGTCQ